jgi:hypothetical protein
MGSTGASVPKILRNANAPVGGFGAAVSSPLSSQATAERERSARDQGEAAGPVVPVAGEKPHARRVAANEHAEAVVLDLMQPPSPSGAASRLGWASRARRSRGRYANATTLGAINAHAAARVESVRKARRCVCAAWLWDTVRIEARRTVPPIILNQRVVPSPGPSA